MTKKWQKATLVVAGVALVANPYTIQLFGMNGIANELYYSTDDELYDKQLQEAKNMIDKAKQTSTEEDVKKAIDTLIQLPWPSGYKTEEKDKLLDDMFFWIDKLSDNNAKVKYGIYFVDASINRVTESLIDPDYKLAHALVFELPEGKVKDKYMTILEKTDETIGKNFLEAYKKDPTLIPNYGFDWSKLPPEAFAPYEPEDTGDILPGYETPDKEPPKPNEDALPEENFTEETVYQTIGQQCYKVITRHVDGKKAVTIKEKVTGYESAYCSVLVVDSNTNGGHNDVVDKPYDFSQVSPSPAGSGDNINGGVSQNNSYFGYNENDLASQSDVNLSNLTLQYTLDKTEKEPYFYETDMIVSKDGTITYQQQRDVLFQLAIRSGGKAVEDKDRFLVLLENKIVVVENQGDKIPVSTFDVILKDFNAQVKAMERKVGQE